MNHLNQGHHVRLLEPASFHVLGAVGNLEILSLNRLMHSLNASSLTPSQTVSRKSKDIRTAVVDIIRARGYNSLCLEGIEAMPILLLLAFQRSFLLAVIKESATDARSENDVTHYSSSLSDTEASWYC